VPAACISSMNSRCLPGQTRHSSCIRTYMSPDLYYIAFVQVASPISGYICATGHSVCGATRLQLAPLGCSPFANHYQAAIHAQNVPCNNHQYNCDRWIASSRTFEPARPPILPLLVLAVPGSINLEQWLYPTQRTAIQPIEAVKVYSRLED
jgi:hypothetical protein